MLATHSIDVDVHLIVAQRQIQREPECTGGGQSSGHPPSERRAGRGLDESCYCVHGMSGFVSTTIAVSCMPSGIATVDGLICQKDRESSTTAVVKASRWRTSPP